MMDRRKWKSAAALMLAAGLLLPVSPDAWAEDQSVMAETDAEEAEIEISDAAEAAGTARSAAEKAD